MEIRSWWDVWGWANVWFRLIGGSLIVLGLVFVEAPLPSLDPELILEATINASLGFLIALQQGLVVLMMARAFKAAMF